MEEAEQEAGVTTFHKFFSVDHFLAHGRPHQYRQAFNETPEKAKAMLQTAMMKGHKVLPFEPCDNFDYGGRGCLGHKD
jgi:hypothetical protein